MAKNSGGKGKGHSPNDNRSISKNPNNPAHKAGQDNRANQLNPNNPKIPKGKSE